MKLVSDDFRRWQVHWWQVNISSGNGFVPVTGNNFCRDLCRQMASLGHNELNPDYGSSTIPLTTTVAQIPHHISWYETRAATFSKAFSMFYALCFYDFILALYALMVFIRLTSIYLYDQNIRHDVWYGTAICSLCTSNDTSLWYNVWATVQMMSHMLSSAMLWINFENVHMIYIIHV